MAVNPQVTAFFTGVLQDLHAPVTPTSLGVLESWSVGEKPAGQTLQWNNPLNTTQAAAGAISENAVGVKAYPTAAAGELATAQTIANGYYPALAAAFKTGAPLSAFEASPVVGEVQNTWGTGSYLQQLTHGAQPISKAGARSSGQPGGPPASSSTSGGGGHSWLYTLNATLNPPASSAGFLGIPGALMDIGSRLGLAAVGLILFLAGLSVVGISALLPRVAQAAVGKVPGVAAVAGAAA